MGSRKKARGRVCLGSHSHLHTYLSFYIPGLEKVWTITFPPHGLPDLVLHGVLRPSHQGPPAQCGVLGSPGLSREGPESSLQKAVW